MTSKETNILIPTDFSKNAWSATLYALNLYADHKCKIYFLNSISNTRGESRVLMTSLRYAETLADASVRDLNELKERALGLNNDKHSFEIISTSEDLVLAIKRTIQNHQIDLVVAGTKGASGLGKFFLGSNAVRMIQNLDICPMLAVPEEYEFSMPKNIAFASNFNRVFQEDKVQVLIDFANLFESHIYVFHINLKEDLSEFQRSNLQELQGYLSNQEHTFHWKEKSDTKSNEINEFVDEFDIDLLAMMNYKHGFIETIMKEPVIKKIGFKPTVPFLVVPVLEK